MRVGHLIQTIDVQAGGTSTAFLNTFEAVRMQPGIVARAYALGPPASDPAWKTIEKDRGAWRLAEGLGRTLAAGDLGRVVERDIRAGELDLLHIHGLWSPDLLAAGLACRKRDLPYIWQPHGMLVREAFAQKQLKKRVFMALGMRRALTGASALLFVTNEERAHSLVPGGVGEERRRVAPLPVALPEGGGVEDVAQLRAQARERFGLPTDAAVVVFLGRFHPVKRLEMAMRAAAELKGRRPDLHLLLVGGVGAGEEAYAESLRGLADSLGLAGRVHFPGWVHGEEKWLALAAGDVLTLQSVHENFGYVAPEALCVGTLPVLTSNLALAEELHSAGVGLTCEPTEAALARAWDEAIERNRRSSIHPRGRAWVEEHLSPRAVGVQLAAMYAEAVASVYRHRHTAG